MKAMLSLAIVVSLTSVSLAQPRYPVYRERGLTLGALVGALTGGAIGHNNGHTGAGAAIGTAVGALTGAALGDSIDSDIAWRDAARRQQRARQMARAVTVADVIAMSQAGLSDAVICTHIRNAGVVARPRPEELITMTKAGVSDTVIQAMQTAPLATASAAPPVYQDRVIVREHYYPAPPPVWIYPDPCFHPLLPRHYHHSGVHWKFSFGH